MSTTVLKAPPKRPNSINSITFNGEDRPKERQLQISKSSIQNIRRYTESFDRKMLRDRATKFNLNTAFIAFELTDVRDPLNNRSKAKDVVAYNFLRLPKNLSGNNNEWKVASIPLSVLNHSWIPQKLIDNCKKSSVENKYYGYGHITDYTRNDSTQSIGFTPVLPQEELALRCLYFLYLAQQRSIGVKTLLLFGLDIIETFSDVFDSNPGLMKYYLNPCLFCDFLNKLSIVEKKAYETAYPKLRVGKSCSILGFKKPTV